MKRRLEIFIVFVAMALIGLLMAHTSEAVTKQSQALGYSSLPAVTKATALTLSVSSGTLVYCSDCGGAGNSGTICVSTGVAVNSLVLSTGTHCQ